MVINSPVNNAMFKNIRQSLITRLMIYFVIAGIAVIALFSINVAFSLKVHFKNEILPNISQYLIYISDDIGTPPDLKKAQQLSAQLSIKMIIKGPNTNWHSNKTLKTLPKLKFESAPHPYQQFKIAHHRHHNFVLLSNGDFDYYFSLKKQLRRQYSERTTLLFIVFIGFLLLLFYLIKHSLKPLKVISKGVKDIANGNLDSAIQIENSYEFQQLAEGINAMSKDIKSMLDSKQQLLLAISHELRSPITRAQVNLALLEENDTQAALKHDLHEMESLISQILESQRLNQTYTKLNKSDIQFDQLINNVIKTYFDKAQIELKLTPIIINADETRLILLIKNLIDNAIKYSQTATQPIHIELTKTEDQIIFTIQDYGIGIKSEELELITQAFYRADKARQRSTGGFGLGLYLAHLIVKAHNAKMHFNSTLNEGTKVTITFPN